MAWNRGRSFLVGPWSPVTECCGDALGTPHKQTEPLRQLPIIAFTFHCAVFVRLFISLLCWFFLATRGFSTGLAPGLSRDGCVGAIPAPSHFPHFLGEFELSPAHLAFCSFRSVSGFLVLPSVFGGLLGSRLFGFSYPFGGLSSALGRKYFYSFSLLALSGRS